MFVQAILSFFVVAVSSSVLESHGSTCDKDILYWAREDVFNPAVTADLEGSLQNCYNSIRSAAKPRPCLGSCNAYVCAFSCAMKNYNFVNIF